MPAPPASPRSLPPRPLSPAAAWARRLLARPWAPWAAVALGLALALPSLGAGFAADDWLHALLVRDPTGLPGYASRPFDLFTLISPGRDDLSLLMERGVFPWTTDPTIQAAFFRPLSSLSHWLDWRLWPGNAPLMHLHSLLWFGALLAGAAALFRRLFGAGWVAGLAALLFAIDDVHGPALGWIANRNALIAGALGIGALLLHDRWRRDSWRPGALLAPLLFALALTAGEVAVGVGGFLLAYALTLEPQRGARRLMSLLPYLLIGAVWLISYRALGYGVHGSGVYIDPGADPLAFFTTAAQRLPVLLVAQLAGVQADTFDLLAGSQIHWYLAGCALWLLLFADAFTPLLRGRPLETLFGNPPVADPLGPGHRISSLARFWALGLLLSLLPVLGSFPSDRLLMVASLGGAGLVASFFEAPEGEPGARSLRRLRRFTVAVWTFGLLLSHVIVAPLLLPARTFTYAVLGDTIERAYESLPHDPGVGERTLVLINPPSDIEGYLAMLRALRGVPQPASFRALASGFDDLTLTRPDAHTLVVRPDSGWLRWTPDRLLRDPAKAPFHVGDRLSFEDLRIEVTAVSDDGRPAEARFRFTRPLDDPRIDWFVWGADRFVPFSPPPVGGRVRLPSIDLMTTYFGAPARAPAD